MEQVYFPERGKRIHYLNTNGPASRCFLISTQHPQFFQALVVWSQVSTPFRLLFFKSALVGLCSSSVTPNSHCKTCVVASPAQHSIIVPIQAVHVCRCSWGSQFFGSNTVLLTHVGLIDNWNPQALWGVCRARFPPSGKCTVVFLDPSSRPYDLSLARIVKPQSVKFGTLK